MSKYYLGRVVANLKSWTGVPIKQLTQEEKDKLDSCISFVPFYYVCNEIWRITIESEKDFINYCKELEGTERIYSEQEMVGLLTTANKFLISFLSFMKTFVDVTSNAVAKKSKADLTRFQTATNQAYDNSFSYRFLIRLRNYVIHHSMPITQIKSDEHGVEFRISRDQLLNYSGWSAVKNEIVNLPEQIDVAQYVEEANKEIDSLYFLALETVLPEVSKGSHYLRETCEKYGITMLAIGEVHEGIENVITWHKFPLHLFKQYIDDIVHNPHIMLQERERNNTDWTGGTIVLR